MATLDAVPASTPHADALRSDLEAARTRIAELETELQRLRGEPVADGPPTPFHDMRLLDVEGRLVKQAMERWQGNISRAARALGLSRSALYRRLERHKIEQTRANE
jgi:transcriptional regulator of acetoin/glycerol metabolism